VYNAIFYIVKASCLTALLIFHTFLFASTININQGDISQYIDSWALSKIDDPDLNRLMVRGLLVDEKKRVYIATDSGLYRYSNAGVEHLSTNDRNAVSPPLGAIVNMMFLNERYLIVSELVNKIHYFDTLDERFVQEPFEILRGKSGSLYHRSDRLLNNESIFSSGRYAFMMRENNIIQVQEATENMTVHSPIMIDDSLYYVFDDHFYYNQQAIYSFSDSASANRGLVVKAIGDNIHLVYQEKHLVFYRDKLISSTPIPILSLIHISEPTRPY